MYCIVLSMSMIYLFDTDVTWEGTRLRPHHGQTWAWIIFLGKWSFIDIYFILSLLEMGWLSSITLTRSRGLSWIYICDNRNCPCGWYIGRFVISGLRERSKGQLLITILNLKLFSSAPEFDRIVLVCIFL